MKKERNKKKMCHEKIGFKSEKDALLWCQGQMEVYKCPACEFWHMAKKKNTEHNLKDSIDG